MPKRSQIFKKLILTMMILCTMGANCISCQIAKECSAFDSKKMQCEQDNRCQYEETTDKCTLKQNALMQGCMDIVSEEACRASKDCFYDAPAKACLDAPGKSTCHTIENDVACTADQNCRWNAEKQVCEIKK
ncbi:MAG TPA: hypothetical protein VEK06_03575 [Myxococcota bacterium]|nr:hypothetical protein [Myxococcota bacterium]